MASGRTPRERRERIEPLPASFIHVLGDEPGLQDLPTLVATAEPEEETPTIELAADRRSATVYGAAILPEIDAVAIRFLLKRKASLAGDRVGHLLGQIVDSAITHFWMEHQQFVAAAGGATVAGNIRHASALACLWAHSEQSASVAKPILQ